MKWLMCFSLALVLTGCCNGSGPGPRAAIDLEPNLSQQAFAEQNS